MGLVQGALAIVTNRDLEKYIDRQPVWACGLAHLHQDPTNTVAYMRAANNRRCKGRVFVSYIEPRLTCEDCPFPDCLVVQTNKADTINAKDFERELARWNI